MRIGSYLLDPFIGSGTTALACIELNRHYTGIELMEDYYKLALNAIAAHCRLVTAVRRGNGERR